MQLHFQSALAVLQEISTVASVYVARFCTFTGSHFSFPRSFMRAAITVFPSFFYKSQLNSRSPTKVID